VVDDLAVVDVIGHRVQWPEVPAHVRAQIAATVGAEVVSAVGQRGGYGPGLAARCTLADGRRMFVKAASTCLNPDTPAMVREEAATGAALPVGAPAARLLHVVDDGDWVALVFEDVDGRHPAVPWRDDELRRVLAATVRLGALAPPALLPTVATRYGAAFRGWRTLAGETAAAVPDPWCARHLDRLAELEARWEEVTVGPLLVHGDVRSDNVLLVGDDVVFVDWTSTCTGVGWFDLVAMLPSVELEGGGPPERVLELAGVPIDPEALLPVVTAVAGYLTERGRLPDPPGLPTLRAFQRAQGAVARAWLRRLLPTAAAAGGARR
jgi:aminoglycoside phosphotransferase (APT) family kinase protein